MTTKQRTLPHRFGALPGALPGALFGALAAGAVIALGTASTGALAEGVEVPGFDGLDADGDGTMSESEWMDSPMASAMGADVAAAHYRMYDVDGDGGVSALEYAEVNRQAFDALENEAI